MRMVLAAILTACLAAVGGCWGGCVREGTLVGTPAGDVPIEKLAVGDEVWTSGPAGREVGRVVKVHRAWTDELVRIEAPGATVEATPTHLIAVPDGWARAGDLGAKAAVVDAGLRPVDARVERRRERARVYDLSVAPNQNYFAGGVLVHNKSVMPQAGPIECTGAFGFFTPAGAYEQVELARDGTGKATRWAGPAWSEAVGGADEDRVEWGLDWRNIEIVRKSAGGVVQWTFKGFVRGGSLNGELADAEGRHQVVLFRPTVLKQMLEKGGLPPAPAAQDPHGDPERYSPGWPPTSPSRR